MALNVLMQDRLCIYALRVSGGIDDDQWAALLDQATPARQARIKKMRRKADALRSLAAELLLCRVALPHAGLRDDCPLFTCNAYGKPSLAKHPEVHFNLSHAGDLVVCAVDSRPVGIDVEEIQPIDASVAQICCTREEICRLTDVKASERLRCFYDIWTIKESYVKAMGKGLAFPINSFSVRKNKHGKITIFPSPDEWFFHQYHIDDRYVLSVCAAHDNFPANVLWIDMSEFKQGRGETGTLL